MLLRRAFLISSVAWAACLPLTAFAASRPDAASAVYGFAIAVYRIGHLICHQLPARSFHLWGAVLPVCARCTGIYVGASAAALLRASRGGGSGLRAEAHRATADEYDRVRVGLLMALLPTAATLVFEWSTGVTPSNWIRAFAGIPLGAAVAWAVGMVN